MGRVSQGLLLAVGLVACSTGGKDDAIAAKDGAGCFPFNEAPPGATARFVEPPAGLQAADTKFAQVVVTFTQADVRLNNASARETGGSGASLEVVNQVARTGAYDMLVRVPDRVKDFGIVASAACGTGTAKVNVDVIIEIDDTIETSAYAQ